MENTKPKEIHIIDETLRDGEQSPGVCFSFREKVKLIETMEEAGIDTVDVGLPIVSLNEAKTIKNIFSRKWTINLAVSIRAKKQDVDVAMSCGAREAFLFTPVSDLHLTYKFNTTRAEAEERALQSVEYAVQRGMVVNFVAEDTARADMDFIIPLFDRVARAGADKIIICDTVSVLTPEGIKDLCLTIRQKMRERINFGIHCHNDFGLATANTLAAIEAGVEYPTLTVNGIGERAGNASMEEVVMAAGNLLKIKHHVKTEKLYTLAKLVEDYSGIIIAPNKSVVGYNAFRHESGIHVDGILKSLETYEPIRPEEVGRERAFVLGKHSGRSLVRRLLQEQGIDAKGAEVDRIVADVKKEKESDSKGAFEFMMIFLFNWQKTGQSLCALWFLSVHEKP
ncbi:MAG: 2-isopropylmalate synthase [Proteobacteria bacterium]|nr:2-isopropylmalate synthase [Pseudomonadota bacterium]